MVRARLLQYLVPFEEFYTEHEGNIVKMIENYPIDTTAWYSVEKNDYLDCYRIWFILGDYNS